LCALALAMEGVRSALSRLCSFGAAHISVRYSQDRRRFWCINLTSSPNCIANSSLVMVLKMVWFEIVFHLHVCERQSYNSKLGTDHALLECLWPSWEQS
jgi:hypothetical protein